MVLESRCCDALARGKSNAEVATAIQRPISQRFFSNRPLLTASMSTCNVAQINERIVWQINRAVSNILDFQTDLDRDLMDRLVSLLDTHRRICNQNSDIIDRRDETKRQSTYC